MHQANKYMRVQDQNGQIAVIVPETDFILHARQMRDLTNKVEQMNRDLKTLNAKNHEYITYKSEVNELITKEVQKARTQQRQKDAKVYAHWRDKAKSLEEQIKRLKDELTHTSTSLYDRVEELKVAREFLNRKVLKETTDWYEKHRTLVYALEPLSQALSYALKGDIYKSLSIDYNEPSESSSL